jgi:hypothetical protein
VRPRRCGARRRSGASRAGPSGSSEGDGDGLPSPRRSHVVAFAFLVALWRVFASARGGKRR